MNDEAMQAQLAIDRTAASHQACWDAVHPTDHAARYSPSPFRSALRALASSLQRLAGGPPAMGAARG